MKKRRIRKKLIAKMLDMRITNKQMAKHIGIEPTRMSEYRHGYRKNLTSEQIKGLCVMLACYPEDILYKEDLDKYWSD